MDIAYSSSADASERAVWVAAIGAAMPEARIVDISGGALAVIDDPAAVEFAVVANPPTGSLRDLPNLRLIQSTWAGVDRLVSDPSLPPDVPIARMVDPAMTAAMAQTALWATLALHRGFFDYAEQQRAGRWSKLPQRRAQEIHVVVLGFGQMGRAAAWSLAAQGYRVSGWRARVRREGEVPTGGSNSSNRARPSFALGESVMAIDERAGVDALPSLLADAQVVVNLLPLTDATTGLLDARFFSRLPQGAHIVNLARGAHLVEADLLAALACGQIGRAVLDVFASEPLPAGHPFWRHPGVTVLPHVAALGDRRNSVEIVCANLRRVASGGEALHQVERDRGY